MRVIRVYHPDPIQMHRDILLGKAATHHLVNVLRIKAKQNICLFNGDGKNYLGHITKVDKRAISVKVTDVSENHSESPLQIRLVQAVSRGDKMDYTLQKAIELGVTEICPVVSERCGVRLSAERWAKKEVHWQHIIISACEQSGRSTIPTMHPVCSLEDYMENFDKDGFPHIALSPRGSEKLTELSLSNQKHIGIFIGPEGGFSDAEEKQLSSLPYSKTISFGPRILRTETAGLAILSAIQTIYGDTN
jgi:16S rRNA (uracil1498-N3)-methyltransferase